MSLEFLFRFLIGVYLLIASYFVVKKDKLILLIGGYAYIQGKKVTNIKKLSKELSDSAKFLGVALIVFSIIDPYNSNGIVGVLEWGCIIKYLLDIYVIRRNIINEKYEE
jgi:hypothetical protein